MSAAGTVSTNQTNRISSRLIGDTLTNFQSILMFFCQLAIYYTTSSVRAMHELPTSHYPL